MFSPSLKHQEQVKKERKSWCLFQATDFQSLMYPCFIFCRILGIFPYNINASDFKTYKPCYFLSAIIKCIIGFCVIMGVIKNIRWYNTLDEYNSTENISTTILGSFIIIVTLVSNGPRLRLLQNMVKISSRLPSEIYKKQSILIHSKDILGFLFLLIYSFFCYRYMSVNVLIKAYVLYKNLLVFLLEMMYINCVYVLKSCFKKINNDLANLLINDDSHIVKWINNVQRNYFLLMELKDLKKQHLMISNTVQKLNIIFSPQLLAIIATNFIHFTFEIYMNIVKWQDGLSFSWTNQIYRVYLIPFLASFLVKLALTAWACETGKNQAIKISTTIHDVLNNTDDKKIKRELQLFSLQIMHCNNTFSAKGLPLDATLIKMMIGSITTYVLILIQFLIASHSCDGKKIINLRQVT